MTPQPDPSQNQPLYVPPEERVTLDELKQRVEQIQNLAKLESKELVKDVAEDNLARTALVVVGVIVVAASLAYFLGRRAAARGLEYPVE